MTSPRRRVGRWRGALMFSAVAIAVMISSGCGGAIGRVTLPRAFLYQSTTVPISIGAEGGPQRGAPVAIPPVLERFEVSAYGVDPNPPIVGPPGDYSIAWGDVSWHRIMAESGFQRIVYADGEYRSILGGMYERATIVVYGVPAGVEDSAGMDGPPPWAQQPADGLGRRLGLPPADEPTGETGQPDPRSPTGHLPPPARP